MQEEIRRLLKEAIKSEHERRAEARHPFVYPVSIHRPNEPIDLGFSRDLSLKGIGLILSRPWEPGSVGDLEIQSKADPVCIKSEVRWSREYGDGWHLVGWRFMSLVTLQIVAQTTR